DWLARLPNTSRQSLTTPVSLVGGRGLERAGVAARPLPGRGEMHRLAVGVDLPVLGELPVEHPAQAIEDAERRLLPTRRGDERLRDREPGCLQDLGALPVAN